MGRETTEKVSEASNSQAEQKRVFLPDAKACRTRPDRKNKARREKPQRKCTLFAFF